MKTMNYSLIRTVCALIIGLVLVLWPDAAVQYLVITLGVLFLIPGFISIISYLQLNQSKVFRVVFRLKERVVCFSVSGWW